MKKYLKINFVLTKEDETDFTESELYDFMDKFTEFIENEKMIFGGMSNICTEEELDELT